MNSLASRKSLLLAESELNRDHMMQECHILADEVHALAKRAKTTGSLISSAAILVAGLGFCRCKPSAPSATKPSWLQTILKGAELLFVLWPKIRPPARD